MNKYEMECVLRSAYYEVLDNLQIEDGEPEIEFVETMKDKYTTRWKNIWALWSKDTRYRGYDRNYLS